MPDEPDLIRVRFPNSGVVFTYTSQGERDRSLRLAEARQQLAHEGSFLPTWQELTDEDRAMAEVQARNWLRAAERAGLLAPVVDDQAAETAVRPVHSYAPPEYVLARCGGRSGVASIIWTDVTCPACRVLLPDLRGADTSRPEAAASGACRKCHLAFDPADNRFDGHAEDRSTPGFCRSCVDQCHEGDSDHRCVVCA